jgi:class 3 adenylate cyclase
LAGYTALSEQLGHRIVPVLNEYLGEMVPMISSNRGYVNKFIGDGIMCFFGAPVPDADHTVGAVEAVLGMQAAITGFNERLRQRELPTVFVRAGIATGLVIVGDAGTADRSDYTVLGPIVNLSARLESANKYTGTRNMLTQRSADLLRDRYLLRTVGRIQVVGTAAAEPVYEALARVADATEPQRLMASLSAQLLEHFTARRFIECLDVLDEIDRAFGPDKLTVLYRAMCVQHVASPPSDSFQGDIVLAQK